MKRKKHLGKTIKLDKTNELGTVVGVDEDGNPTHASVNGQIIELVNVGFEFVTLIKWFINLIKSIFKK